MVAKDTVKIAHLVPSEFFSESKANPLNGVLEADYVYIWSHNDVVVNMSRVNFLVKDDGAIAFIFNDNTRLVVYKGGEVVFVSPNASSEEISPAPEPGQNWVAHEEE